MEALQKQLDEKCTELEQLKKIHDDLQEEFKEFQETSKELEEESEAELRQTTKQLEAAQAKLSVESKEKAALLERLAKAAEGNAEIDRLNQELEKQKLMTSDLRVRIAALETENDEYSQREREASSQNELLQQKVDEALESIALSNEESEEMKRAAAEAEQRLMEENKDLQAEITALKHKSAKSGAANPTDAPAPPEHSEEVAALREQVALLQAQLSDSRHRSPPAAAAPSLVFTTPGRDHKPSALSPAPHTPYAPTSPGVGSDTPLASVHQLLDRVQGLHSRLKNCRSRVGALLSPSTPPAALAAQPSSS